MPIRLIMRRASLSAYKFLLSLAITSGAWLALLWLMDGDTVGAQTNNPPVFDEPVQITATISEDAPAGTMIATYNATDVDGSDTLEGIHFRLTDADDLRNFGIVLESSGDQISGELVVKRGANLDVDAPGTFSSHTVELAVCDADNACSELVVVITVTNVNDNAPIINANAPSRIAVAENTPRGYSLGNYGATDADGDAITYILGGPDSGSFSISDTGILLTLESLDADSNTPCGSAGCEVKITAADDGAMTDTVAVTIGIEDRQDSVSTFMVKKANPVPGVFMGDADTALADVKMTMAGQTAIQEAPSDLPATGTADQTAPVNFVETEWANWGTVLRIEVSSESPSSECGNGNQCVFIDVEADSAYNKMKLIAYRSGKQENLFLAAVKIVEDNSTDESGKAIYKDTSGGVAMLEADEEDAIIFRLADSKVPPVEIDVENEAPEFSYFTPKHESAFDDGEVDYVITIMETYSGIPEPEDLPDNDGDEDYMPLVALISRDQCHTEDLNKGYTNYPLAGNALWCSNPPELRHIVDDRDFDEIDYGFDIETKIVLPENETRYVSFISCDNAGNCALYTPDKNNVDEALAEITVDTVKPSLVEARTGVSWDTNDNEYRENRNFIQAIFDELTQLNPETVESDDFVVGKRTVKDVHVFENPGDDEVDWTASGRFAMGGRTNLRGVSMYRDIENSVFIELDDELYAGETPYVVIVPYGIADMAGNERDNVEIEADDWISPTCVDTIAGDGDIDGSWTGDCASKNRSGSYARYYQFPLTKKSDVMITLESDVDTYLYLLQGAGRDGAVVDNYENDDHTNSEDCTVNSQRSTDSCIAASLETGDYTIEVTTYHAGATGDFMLTVTGLDDDIAPPLPSGIYKSLVVGELHTCGLQSDGVVACWGNNDYGQVSDTPAGVFKFIAAGAHHTCGSRYDDTIACWGRNDYAQSSAPSGRFITFVVGTYHNCGIRTDGAVVCWGRNDYGQAPR